MTTSNEAEAGRGGMQMRIRRTILRRGAGGESHDRRADRGPTGARRSVAAQFAWLASLLFGSPWVGHAQAPDTNWWVPNDMVYALVVDGETVYIGGYFTQVGPATGGGVPIDASTGAVQQPCPNVVGGVETVAPDGSGGWYLGGLFSAVLGEGRSNLAHVDASGNLTPWNPNANGTVHALAVSGGKVYVGGSFTSVGGEPRNRIAALDASTGAATTWDPDANAVVQALAVGGSMVYTSGLFTNIGGESRDYIAALDASSGAATAWDPGANLVPYCLALDGSTLYVGGDFHTIGGQTRQGIAALDTATGTVKPWNPNAIGTVHALAVSGGIVYAGGDFVSIGGKERHYIAALDSSGVATGWNPDADYGVYSLALDGGMVYAGGFFTHIGSQSRNHLAALDAVNGTATSWNPNASGMVASLAVSGGTVFAGGYFNSLGGQARNHIAALDATTGVLKAWDPNVDGFVYALAVSNGTVYAGGLFSHVGSQSRGNIAAIDATSGAATSWDPNAFADVYALAVSEAAVYVGGHFVRIGGQERRAIAALDRANGAAMAWDPGPHDQFPIVRALALSGGTLFVGGSFTEMGGELRDNIAALDLASGSATPWNPGADYPVAALALSGGTLYVSGNFSSIGGQPRNGGAALDTQTGTPTGWNPSNGANALAVDGDIVFCGGGFTFIGGQPRNGLAALDAASGAATPWDPNVSGYGTVFDPSPIGAVFCLAVNGPTVYAGGSFNGVGRRPQANLAAISSPVTSVEVSELAALQDEDGNIVVSWFVAPSAELIGFDVLRARHEDGAYVRMNSTPVVGARRVTFEDSSDDVKRGGQFFYKIVAIETNGETTVFGPVQAAATDHQLPVRLALHQSAPNPFLSSTLIRYDMPRSERVTIQVFDVAGRLVRTLVDRHQAAGRLEVLWNGQDARGVRVASGTYFLRMRTSSFNASRKIVVR